MRKLSGRERHMKPLFCILYSFVFMGIGVLSPLIGPYLQSIGFSGEQIGIITAAGTCTVIFASPFWGHLYSAIRLRSRRFLLVAAVLFCAAFLAMGLSRMQTFAGVLVLFILVYFFQSPSSALLDSMTIDEGQKFGHVRTFGAAGFAVSCFAAAQAAGAMGIQMIFPIYALCFTASAVVVLVIRGNSADIGKPEREKIDTEESLRRELEHMEYRSKGRDLVSNRTYCLLLLCAFFINGTDIANNTFFSFLYLEGGGTLAGVGVAFLLMAGSEAPFMAASDRLCRRFGQGWILLAAMIFSVIRFALFALGLSAPILIALFPLQGFVNGLTLVEFVKYIARIIPKQLRAPGIAVYYAFCNSCSTILCQLIGGRLLEHGVPGLSGAQSVYLFFALFNIAGIAVFLGAKLYRTAAGTPEER